MSKRHKRQRKRHRILNICDKSKNHFYLKSRVSDRKFFNLSKTYNTLTTRKSRQFVQNRSMNNTKKNAHNNPKRKKKNNTKPSAGPLQHVFYAIVNTSVCMDKGTMAAMVGRSLIALHNTLESDDVKSEHIDKWTMSGEDIIVLKGYDHKHLRYLQEEVKYSAIGTHALIQNWDGTRLILVLSIFGVVENLEDVIGDLSPLQ